MLGAETLTQKSLQMVCGTYGRAIVGQSTWRRVLHSKLLDSIMPDTTYLPQSLSRSSLRMCIPQVKMKVEFENHDTRLMAKDQIIGVCVCVCDTGIESKTLRCISEVQPWTAPFPCQPPMGSSKSHRNGCMKDLFQ